MTDSEQFTLISGFGSQSLYPDYEAMKSAKTADQDVQITAALRTHYPELTVTVVPSTNCPLLTFAAMGFASADLDTTTENVIRWRGYIGPNHRGGSGQLGDAIFFAKYHYKWGNEDFLLYTIGSGFPSIQYILKEPASGEDVRSHCRATDSLIRTVVTTVLGDENEFIYVFDRYWTRSRELWEEVQQASWDKVILDAEMKKQLTRVAENFFDSKEIYKKYGVAWKRGLIFHGPPGNGKTISLKALMHTLYARKGDPIPTLYVKSAPNTYSIQQVFLQARRMSPCLLVMEDIETIVTSATRSYFFNEVDGLANNDGILMIASTNFLERLDPGLAKRPSRFDRKYLFPLPNKAERTLYAIWWRNRLAISSPTISFPSAICPAFADVTTDFSFAYMQEAFIATLLALARDAQDNEASEDEFDVDVNDDEEEEAAEEDNGDDEHKELEKYKLWRFLKAQVQVLRGDMGASETQNVTSSFPLTDDFPPLQISTMSLPSPFTSQHPQTLSPTPGRSRQMPPHFVSFNERGEEADPAQLAAHGVFKRHVFTETAFELM